LAVEEEQVIVEVTWVALVMPGEEAVPAIGEAAGV
jgi:hypothetical protein